MSGNRGAEGALRQRRERDVVIIGGGFGGLACARALGGKPLSVTVIDRRNYHLFQPLLYQVATAALSPADIAQPIRRILAPYPNVDVAMGEVTAIDLDGRTVTLDDGSDYDYGRLVLATGSEYNYFGHEAWSEFAPGLKSIEDARRIRSTLLRNFELAETSDDPNKRAALITTVVVGGGPTGVEMAGAIAELSRWTLARDFRHIDPASARTLLVEAGPRLLAAFPEELAVYAADRLRGLGVTVITGASVDDVRPDSVVIAGRETPCGAVVWGAGIRATGITQALGVPLDRTGRISVGSNLAIVGREDAYAIGDCAVCLQDGQPLPALAQVAKQQGEYLGRVLGEQGGVPKQPFRFHNRGNTAVVGRNAAVLDVGKPHLRGGGGWVVWGGVDV